MLIAKKTLEAIEEGCRVDQGNLFRHHLKELLPTMEDAYRWDTDGFRSHMGASVIGRKCAREVWYMHRWAVKSDKPGQLIRLFNRGHLEEARFLACLKMINCQIMQQDENGHQFRISGVAGHFGGSGDGFVYGVPDMPNMWLLSEFKTANDKVSDKLMKTGVADVKPEHKVQMSMYGAKFKLDYSLYMSVKKSSDQIHAEIVETDLDLAARYEERAEKLVWMELPPERIAKSVGSFDCKFCDYKDVCHNGVPPSVNCRTCEHSIPFDDHQNGGAWGCRKFGIVLSKELQLTACKNYTQRSCFGR